ncbi:MAG: hypothetical protein K8G79_04805 [bacterium]|uniref:Uncharacterized protein n=1 Tax=Candidatus Methylomirabilis tolerans TaxID=3123416 RepID=A0AAJ1AHU6_9BACT|nr:hypothetical protein [Candidatus Methylomirabilis sp.]
MAKQIITIDIETGTLISVTNDVRKSVDVARFAPTPNNPLFLLNAGPTWRAPATPPSGRRMVITMDADTDELISVTDEAGKPAARFEPTPDNPVLLGQVVGGVGHAIIRTRNSPGCVTYFRNGVWRRVC